MEKIKSYNEYKKQYVFYPLEENDISKGYIIYKKNEKFKLKLLHLTLIKLKEFLKKEDLNFKFYTKININNFNIDRSIFNEKDTIVVKLPFFIKINNIYKI